MALPLNRTRAVLEAGIENGLHLGAQLYVSMAGESAALALGERAPGQAMTADTLNIWLSSSKPIAAVVVAQLWERGALELDDPVARFLPEFAQGGKGAITLRHILTHTGGFRMLNVGWPEACWDEIIATICRARREPRWPLGRKAGYHLTSSWFILGEVIRRIDGRPYREVVRQEVFEPLGMDDSWVGMPAERFEQYGDRIGQMFATEKGHPQPRAWHKPAHVVGCSPGGNGYGPIRELGRFYEMLLGRGILEGQRLLTAQTVEALVAPHRVGLVDHTFKVKLDWGLGFICDSKHYAGDGDPIPYGYGRHASRRTYGHSGYQSSTGFADPEHGLVVAVVVNGNPGDRRHAHRIHAVTEAIYEDLELPT